MFVLLMVSMYLALHHRRRLAGDDPYCAERHHDLVGGHHHGLRHFRQRRHLATNWTRLANSSRTAILASTGSFLIGNGLMIVAERLVRYRLSTGRYR